MKSKLNIFIASFAVVALLFSAVALSKDNVAKAGTVAADTTDVRVITASGEGAIEAAPDVAYISIGVITEGKELSKVQADNAAKMSTVMASLTKLGIKKEEIKTTAYNVSPKYDWNQSTGVSTIIGYTVSNTLDVTINDITKTGSILDAVVANGSNSINSVRFGLKNETELYNKALELAVKDAKAKATAMGKGLGITVVGVSKVSEVSNRTTPIYYERDAAMKSEAQAVTPISEGQLKISASVSVEFSFK